MTRALLALLLCAGCAAHDLGYLPLSLERIPDGYRLEVGAGGALLPTLAAPRLPPGFTLVAEGDAGSFILRGPRELDQRDRIVLPWDVGGVLLSARLQPEAEVVRALIPRNGAAITIALARFGAGPPGAWTTLGDYLTLGFEHIAGGLDHLAFVAGLLLLLVAAGTERRWRRLVGAITAFTLGHSLSLGAATLGLPAPGGAPVEVLIALSVVVLAAEVVHTWRGAPGLAARHPALIAAAFGLLHGLGFAGALAELGLPGQAVALPLLGFNLGVELGQLVAVAVLLLIAGAFAPLLRDRGRSAGLVAAYALGITAAAWTIQRAFAA